MAVTEGNVFWKGGVPLRYALRRSLGSAERPEFWRIRLLRHAISQIGIGDCKEDGWPVANEYGVGVGEA
jgi:hypothetical protein